MQKTLIHLIPIGISGSSQEWAVGLAKGSTIKVEVPNEQNTIHDLALTLARFHLNVDDRFLLLKPATFIQANPAEPVNLIFTVKVPMNIKLTEAQWIKSSELSSFCDGNTDYDNTLRVIAEAINHG